MDKPKILCIVGPTASGKTKLATQLAKKYNGEIISADSMQIYAGMDIGTAKPDMAERDGVPHHMLDVALPGEVYSVARYVEQACKIILEVTSRGKLPIVVGGTGLYIDCLVRGMSFAAFDGDVSYRNELMELAQEKGAAALHEIL